METDGLPRRSEKILQEISHLLSGIRKGEDVQTNRILSYIENLASSDENEQKIIHEISSELNEIKNQMFKLKWLNNHYKILHDFSQICSKTLNEETLLKKAYELVSQVMPTDAFFIATYNEGDPEIKFILLVENGEFYPQTTLEFGENYTSMAIKTREIIHHRYSMGTKHYVLIVGDNLNGSNLFVPVVIDDQVKGVISAQSVNDFAYLKEHEELLQLIGTQIFNSIETARLYEKIYKMSQTDELTGLKNHRAFHKDLNQFIDQTDEPIVLIMMDSDDLKIVNDRYGHDVGDHYLRVIADGIKNISSNDIIGYRYAGDEFMIIMKGDACQDMASTVAKLQMFYHNNTICQEGNKITISISMGLAIYPKHGATVDTIKKSADKALYQAKQNGKNKVAFAHSL